MSVWKILAIGCAILLAAPCALSVRVHEKFEPTSISFSGSGLPGATSDGSDYESEMKEIRAKIEALRPQIVSARKACGLKKSTTYKLRSLQNELADTVTRKEKTKLTAKLMKQVQDLKVMDHMYRAVRDKYNEIRAAKKVVKMKMQAAEKVIASANTPSKLPHFKIPSTAKSGMMDYYHKQQKSVLKQTQKMSRDSLANTMKAAGAAFVEEGDQVLGDEEDGHEFDRMIASLKSRIKRTKATLRAARKKCNMEPIYKVRVSALREQHRGLEKKKEKELMQATLNKQRSVLADISAMELALGSKYRDLKRAQLVMRTKLESTRKSLETIHHGHEAPMPVAKDQAEALTGALKAMHNAQSKILKAGHKIERTDVETALKGAADSMVA